jgi:hypothetical protein
MSTRAGRLVGGLTFVAVGALLLLHAADVLDVPAAAVPGILLVGLGLALLLRGAAR